MDGDDNLSFNNLTISDLDDSLPLSDRQQELVNMAQEFGLLQIHDSVFRLVDSADQLKSILDSHDKNKRLTIVCNTHNYWITLIIDYTNSVAYYTDTRNEKIAENLEQILLDHVPNLNVVNVQLGNAGYALVNAKIINDKLNNRLVVAEGAYKELTDSAEIVSKKFDIVLKYITPLINDISINTRNANILLYFLETVALQDVKLRDINGKKLNLDRIINKNDRVTVSGIRNYLVHRKLNATTQKFTWIEPKHLNDIITNNNSNVFKAMHTYLEYIQKKLHDEFVVEPNDLKTPSWMFKKNFNIGTDIDKAECEEKISAFVKSAMSEAFDKKRLKSNNARDKIFEFIVNVVPYMKLQKNNMLKVLGSQRNDQIHVFYKHVHTESELAFAFRHYMRQNRKHLYAFCLSKIVGELLNQSANTFDTIKQVKTDVETVRDYLTNRSCQIFKNLGEANNCNYDIENLVRTWFEILLFLDNESAVQDRIDRQKKTVHVKGRHVDLTADDRENVANFIKFLKQQYAELILNHAENSDQFKQKWVNNLKSKYEKEFRNHYGIMSKHLKMLFLHIEQKLRVDDTHVFYSETVRIIIKNVKALMDFKKSTKMNIKDIIKEDILNDPSKINFVHGQSKIQLFYPESNTYYGQTICRRRFSVIIFEILCNDDVFKNIEEAFNDEDFLDYLEINNSVEPQFDDFPIFATPYMGRLLNQSYKNFQNLKTWNVKKYREKILVSLMIPNFKHHVYSFMSKDFKLYWNVAVNIILRKYNADAAEQLKILEDVTDKWTKSYKNKTEKNHRDFLNLLKTTDLQTNFTYVLDEMRKLVDNKQKNNQRRNSVI